MKLLKIEKRTKNILLFQSSLTSAPASEISDLDNKEGIIYATVSNLSHIRLHHIIVHE